MSDGPYLTAALICERVIEGKDSVLSVIRIIDSIIVDLPDGSPDNFPSEENRLPVAFDGLVSLRTGKAPGSHTVRIDLISPSGKRSASETHTLALPDEEHSGANLTLHHTVHVKQGGLFHFEVFIDDMLAARIPFRIDVRRPTTPGPPSTPQGDRPGN